MLALLGRRRSQPLRSTATYNFDLDLLRDVATEIEAPTVAEVRVPLPPDAIPTDTSLKAFEEGPVRAW